nr:hypothetical protein Iba_scaffold1677901CG0010 [Ipomoea batatas]
MLKCLFGSVSQQMQMKNKMLLKLGRNTLRWLHLWKGYHFMFHCIKSQKEMSLASSLHSFLGTLQKLLHMETRSKRRSCYSLVPVMLQRIRQDRMGQIREEDGLKEHQPWLL